MNTNNETMENTKKGIAAFFTNDMMTAANLENVYVCCLDDFFENPTDRINGLIELLKKAEHNNAHAKVLHAILSLSIEPEYDAVVQNDDKIVGTIIAKLKNNIGNIEKILEAFVKMDIITKDDKKSYLKQNTQSIANDDKKSYLKQNTQSIANDDKELYLEQNPQPVADIKLHKRKNSMRPPMLAFVGDPTEIISKSSEANENLHAQTKSAKKLLSTISAIVDYLSKAAKSIFAYLQNNLSV